MTDARAQFVSSEDRGTGKLGNPQNGQLTHHGDFKSAMPMVALHLDTNRQEPKRIGATMYLVLSMGSCSI